MFSEEEGLDERRLQLCIQCGMEWVHPMADACYGEQIHEICRATAVCGWRPIGVMAAEIKGIHLVRQKGC